MGELRALAQPGTSPMAAAAMSARTVLAARSRRSDVASAAASVGSAAFVIRRWGRAQPCAAAPARRPRWPNRSRWGPPDPGVRCLPTCRLVLDRRVGPVPGLGYGQRRGVGWLAGSGCGVAFPAWSVLRGLVVPEGSRFVIALVPCCDAGLCWSGSPFAPSRSPMRGGDVSGLTSVIPGRVRVVRSGVCAGGVLGGKPPAFGGFPADAPNHPAKVTGHRRPTDPATPPGNYATTHERRPSKSGNKPARVCWSVLLRPRRRTRDNSTHVR